MRWKRFGLILVALGLLAPWAGCSSKPTEPDSPPPTGSNSAYPLTIGSWWKYEVVQRSTWSWAPEDTVLRVDTVVARVIDTTRMDPTNAVAAVVVYEPHFPALLGSVPDTIFVVAPPDASFWAPDTVFLYQSRIGSPLWRAYALGDYKDDTLPTDCILSVKAPTVYPSFFEIDSLAPQPFEMHCPWFESLGEVRRDWLQPGVGLVTSHHYYVGSPGDASTYVVAHYWLLLKYHIELQPTRRGQAQR